MPRARDKVRVAEVAVRVGVSEMTIYNYFPSKEAPILDQVPKALRQARSAWVQMRREAGPGDGR
ncbi:MAG: TetR family transcriptional regulator [Solirubrobacteraceae bacterium]